MQKAETQHHQTQRRPIDRQGKKGTTVESSRAEQIAQLKILAENSSQTRDQTHLTAMMNSSPLMVAQHRLAEMIHNSPRQAAQHKISESIDHSPHLSVQRQKLGNALGETAQEDTEETLQLKAAQREAAPTAQNQTGLPNEFKDGIESLSGISMDNVKVHYNSAKPAQLNALAYAQGTDIHVAPGQEKHLPHEAWHVVQQAQGRVKPTTQMKNGVPVNDDQGLEREADVMGERALREKPVVQKTIRMPVTTFAESNESTTSLRQTELATPNEPIQRIRAKETSPSNNFVDKEMKGNRAGKVVGQAVTPDRDGGVPSVNPTGWIDLINNVAKIKGSWVRFHVINQYLGGPGNKTWNLVPTTVQTNHRSDWKTFEQSAQDALYVENKPVFMSVEVDYPDTSTGFPSQIQGTTESYDSQSGWQQLGGVNLQLSQPQLGSDGQVWLYAGELTAEQWQWGVGMPKAVAQEVVKFAHTAQNADHLIALIEDRAYEKDRGTKDWREDTLEQIEDNIFSASNGMRKTRLCIQF